MLKEKIDEELNRQKKAGFILKLNNSGSGTSIVPIVEN